MTNTPYIIYWFISSCRGNETRTRIPTKVRTPNAVGNQLPVTPLFIGNIFLLFLYQLSYLPKLFDFVGRVRLELTTLWFSVKCLLKYLLCVSFICISLYEYCAKIYKIFLISKFSMNFFYLKPHFFFCRFFFAIYSYTFCKNCQKFPIFFLWEFFLGYSIIFFFSSCWVSSW